MQAWKWLGGAYIGLYGSPDFNDRQKGRFYLKKAANQTHCLKSQAWAWFFLGGMYLKGRGVVKKPKKALEYYRRAIDQEISGGVKAYSIRAYSPYLVSGEVIPKDWGKSIEYDEWTAKQQYDKAMRIWANFRLGKLCYKGDGHIKQNFPNAKRFYKAVVKESKDIAKLEVTWSALGEIYLLGKGETKKKPEKALKYFMLLEKRGKDKKLRHKALYRIGEDYYLYKKNIKKALEYFQAVAKCSDSQWAQKEAKGRLEKMNKK